MEKFAPEWRDYPPDFERLRGRVGESQPVTEISAGPSEFHYFETGSGTDGSRNSVCVEFAEGLENCLTVRLEGFHWLFGSWFRHWRQDFDLVHDFVLGLAKRGWEESTGRNRLGVRYTDRYVTLDDGRRAVQRSYRWWGRQFVR